MNIKQKVKYNLKRFEYLRARRYEIKAYKDLHKTCEEMQKKSTFVCLGNSAKGIQSCAYLNDQVVCNNSKCPSFGLNAKYVSASKKYREAHLSSCQVCGDMICAKTK